MAGVTDIAGGPVRMSISQIATEFRMARNTVSKYLAEARVKPDGKRAGYPIYRLGDVIGILTMSGVGDEAKLDPSKMKPSDRRAYFQSENERLKFEQEEGQLILADEVHAEMAALAKIMVRSWETLADAAERDLRCEPRVIEWLHDKSRAVRQEIADLVDGGDVTEEEGARERG